MALRYRHVLLIVGILAVAVLACLATIDWTVVQPHSSPALAPTPQPKMIRDIVFFPDARRLVYCESTGGGFPYSVKVLNVATRQVEHALAAYATKVALSPDGSLLALGGYESELRVFETATWRERKIKLDPRKNLIPIEFSPDGAYLAAYDETGPLVVIYDSFSGHVLARLDCPDGRISGGAFSQDCKELLVAGRRVWLNVFKSPDWKQVRSWSVPLEKDDDSLRSIAAARKSRMIATVVFSGRIEFWSWEGRSLGKLPIVADGVNCLSFSPDGKLLAAGCGIATAWPGSMVVWDVASQQEVARFKHSEPVCAVAFAPVGGLLVSGSADGELTFRSLER